MDELAKLWAGLHTAALAVVSKSEPGCAAYRLAVQTLTQCGQYAQLCKHEKRMDELETDDTGEAH